MDADDEEDANCELCNEACCCREGDILGETRLRELELFSSFCKGESERRVSLEDIFEIDCETFLR